MPTERVPLKDIDFDNSPVVRASQRDEVVAEYAECYKTNEPMAPPDLFRIPKHEFFLIADGRHRLHGAAAAGMDAVPCTIHEGGVDDCFRFALQANRTHGIRRSSEDKAIVVETALRRYPNCSNAQIASICAVSGYLVEKVREQLEEFKLLAKTETRTDTMGREQAAKKPRATREDKTPLAIGNGSTTQNVKTNLSPVTTTATASPKPEERLVVDTTGFPVTPESLKFWDRRTEIEDLLKLLAEVKARLTRAMDSRDTLYHGLNFNAAIADLSRLRSNIAAAEPFAVCTECQGRPQTKINGHCPLCGGKGMISEFQWDNLVPEEAKTIREKVATARRAKVKA